MAAKTPAPPKGSLKALVALADKKYNLTVGSLNNIIQESEFYSTGNMAIDAIMGGGVPQGRSVELSGPPSSGKTTTALQTCAWVQKQIISGGNERLGIGPNDYILYLDYEQTIDVDYCASLGLDITHESFQIAQPDTLEDGCNFGKEAAKTGEVRLIVIDSVAAMVPSANAQNEIGKSMAFTSARLLSDFGQQMNPILRENTCSIIYVNHLKEKMDMTGRRPSYLGPVKDTPGGSSLKFYASVRVEYKQLQKIERVVTDPLSGEPVKQPYATNVEVKTTKNKVFPPFRKVVVRVTYGRGFDNFWTAMQILLGSKLVVHDSSGMFQFHLLEKRGLAPEWMPRKQTGEPRPYIKGEKALFVAADAKPEWRDGIIALAEEVAAKAGKDLITKTDASALDPEDEEDGEIAVDAETGEVLD